MNLDEDTRAKVKSLLGQEPFHLFGWETIKRIAQNPRIQDIEQLRSCLERIIINRKMK